MRNQINTLIESIKILNPYDRERYLTEICVAFDGPELKTALENAYGRNASQAVDSIVADYKEANL